MSELGKPDLSEIFSETELDQLLAALERSGHPHTAEDYTAVVHWAMRIHIEYGIALAIMRGRKALFVVGGEVMITDNQHPAH